MTQSDKEYVLPTTDVDNLCGLIMEDVEDWNEGNWYWFQEGAEDMDEAWHEENEDEAYRQMKQRWQKCFDNTVKKKLEEAEARGREHVIDDLCTKLFPLAKEVFITGRAKSKV